MDYRPRYRIFAIEGLKGVDVLESRIALAATAISHGEYSDAALIQQESLELPTLAFPGAAGFGAFAKGGRGGDVYHVTNLNDSGVGSLRYGIRNADGPRTIVFDTSGTINLASRLVIDKPFITIAGQTAPGDGITVRNYGTWISETHDVIIRYMRFRTGDTVISEHDSLVVFESSDVIVDHVSASWSVDEIVDTFRSSNVTVQWSIISEALANSHHSKGSHSAGLLHNFGGLSLHHNLFAHNQLRNPAVRQQVDIVNNVIFNWGDQATLAGWGGTSPDPFGPTQVNLQGNYFVAGPSTRDVLRVYRGLEGSELWASGNLVDGNRNGVLDGEPVNAYSGVSTIVPERFDYPTVPTDDAAAAYDLVLSRAGASLARDDVDLRIINDVIGQTGSIIDSQDQVGGWPELVSSQTPRDSDQDGIPDKWEKPLRHLNHKDASDGSLDPDGDGYTNLEDYLDSLVHPDSGSKKTNPGKGRGNQNAADVQSVVMNRSFQATTDEGVGLPF